MTSNFCLTCNGTNFIEDKPGFFLWCPTCHPFITSMTNEGRLRAIPRYDSAARTVQQVHLVEFGRGIARCGVFSDNKTAFLEDVTCKRCLQYADKERHRK